MMGAFLLMLIRSEKTTLSSEVSSAIWWLYSIFTIIFVVLGVLYLVHSNKTATDGYELLKLEQQRKSLLSDSEQWNTKLSNVLSVSNLQSGILSMGKPDKVTFYKGDSSVASVQRVNIY